MTYDVAIIGGGIVGLASAYKILEKHPGISLIVLEKETNVATHQTDRNSGVIHSGIYYKPGSAKALNCVKGAAMLVEFCKDHQIPYDLCGKVIAAVNEKELPVLEGIFKRGLQNGLNGIKMIDAATVKQIEPHCFALSGIWVPQAGIIDYRVVAERLKQLILQKGGEVVTGFKVERIKEDEDGITIASSKHEIKSRIAVGCAGLYSDHLALMAGLKPPHQIVPFRGEFYSLVPEAEKLVKGLIYPVPDINFPFLGVHLTKRISGGIEAGPNAVLAFRREGYRHMDIHAGELMEALSYKGFQRLALKHWRKGLDEMARSFSARAFLKSLQKLVPELRLEDIKRSRTGVRAQALDKEGNMIDDYVVLRQERMIHICNAPSPAATSCLSIGEYIAGLADEKLKTVA
ncbi:MAG TPA: L-2-hydroxyglutarate oxidase [Saprospiraceae bacterium]|nr:L-2-hydroxyglutarate oxidase [Saprospiraceae bacterium]